MLFEGYLPLHKKKIVTKNKMLKQRKFFDSINCMTLRFKDPEEENRYLENKSKLLLNCNPGKVMIIIAIVVLSGFFSYTLFMFSAAGNEEAIKMVYIILSVVNAAWMIEFLLQFFKSLHLIGGFAFIIMVSWVIIQASTLTLPSFSIVPGGICFIMMILFAGIHFARNWMLATLAHTIGHLVISIISWNTYCTKMDNIRLITVEINMNVGLFISAFIYYYVESQERMRVFATWQTDKVRYLAIDL